MRLNSSDSMPCEVPQNKFDSFKNPPKSPEMDSCILKPPTQRNLSDEIVGGVLQRSKSYRSTYVVCEAPSHVIDTWDKCGSPAAVEGQITSTNTKRKRQELTNLPISESSLLVSSNEKPLGGKQAPRFKGGEEQKAMMMEWIESQMKHQREIRRLRQIRYRKKKEDYTISLELNNRQLQQEIMKLQEKRRSIVTAVSSEKTLWNVVVEYFRLFRFGYREPLLSQELAVETPPSPQLEFLLGSMAPNVISSAGRGVDSILTNWKHFTFLFKDVEIELDELAKTGMGSLTASTTTSFTITKRSLTKVFPNLPHCQSLEGISLGQKLLGQRVVMRGSTRFHWDSRNRQVTSVISESDMLTPLLNILGSLEDVSRVLQKSLISLNPHRE
ncbi:hypothetical protein PsorP6_017305 [Peronosclerospora sorghi]|uniref:Uncharacterized protein n=1 Tax=Peronosclerospora sorghi TaxID=230839 RepID=A0ACC0WNJ8_9STRA|nr:hypothetical protein PsorP6_017305 [Peronosclerospora sorghi]